MANKRANQPGYEKRTNKIGKIYWVKKPTYDSDVKAALKEQLELEKKRREKNKLRRKVYEQRYSFEEKGLELAQENSRYYIESYEVDFDMDTVEIILNDNGEEELQVEVEVNYLTTYDWKPEGCYKGLISLPINAF